MPPSMHLVKHPILAPALVVLVLLEVVEYVKQHRLAVPALAVGLRRGAMAANRAGFPVFEKQVAHTTNEMVIDVVLAICIE